MKWSRPQVIICVVSLFLTGCSVARPTVVDLRPNLLFDTVPPPLSADYYTARTAWLTAPSFVDHRPRVHHREVFFDRQGDGIHSQGHFYRRSVSIREGSSSH